MTRDQYDAAMAQETQNIGAARGRAHAGYPGGIPYRQSESQAGEHPSSYSGTAYGDSSSVTQAMNTPPYGENYGYGSGIRGRAGRPAAAERRPEPRPAWRHRRSDQGRTAGIPAGRLPGQQHRQLPGQRLPGQRRLPKHREPPDRRIPNGRIPNGRIPTEGYPDGGHQGNGHQTGAYQGSAQQANANAYRGNGNGYRAPYDPREDYRRSSPPG